MNLCEQRDNKPTQIIMKAAFRGSTTDELRFLDGKYTYQNSLNYTAQEIKPYLELAMWRLETVYYPACIETLQSYLKKRGTQVKRKGTMQSIISKILKIVGNILFYKRFSLPFFPSAVKP